MNKDNPFIDEGSSPRDLEGTLCNVMQALSVFEDLFDIVPGEELSVRQCAAMGYQLMLIGMRGALGHVMEELSSYPSQPKIREAP